MSSEGPDSVEEVTVLLSGLEITISARRLPVGASASAGTGISAGGTPVPRDTPEDFSDPYNITSEVEDHCIQATTPAQLSQLTLPFLTALVGRLRVGRLRAGHAEWSPLARIHRAFRAGVLARRRLDGNFQEEDSLSVPFRNCYYICLREDGHQSGFWTTDYGIYIERVGGPSGRLHPDSISQALPSQVEAQAFLVGARRPWPRRLPQ